MSLPVERSITVSAPQRVAQRSFSTSSSIELLTAELPMLALILTAKPRPMAIGSRSGWGGLGGGVSGGGGWPSRFAVVPSFRLFRLPLPDPPLAERGQPLPHVRPFRPAGVVHPEGRLATREGGFAGRHPDADRQSAV